MSQAIKQPDRRKTFMSIGLLFLSGLGFTISMVIANMAFKDGVDLNTSNTLRYGMATVILIIYQKARGKKIGLLPRERYISLALGI